jgi:integrase
MRKPTDLGAIRAQTNSILGRDRKPATQHEYERAFLRLAGEHWHAYAKRHAVAKRTAVLLRNAWRWGTARRVREMLADLDRATDPVKRSDIRNDLTCMAAELRRSQPGYEPPASVKCGKQSKRKSLTGLPKDWRVLLLHALDASDRLPYAVMALSGCRPAELKMGVRLRLIGEHVELLIQGAKVSALTNAGQPERMLRVSPAAILGSPYSTNLKRWLEEQGGETIVAIFATGRAFEQRLERAAKRAGLGAVSCYSLRHQMAADLKGEVTQDEVSLTLGHVSRRSKKHYGHARQRRSNGGFLVSVDASRELRGSLLLNGQDLRESPSTESSIQATFKNLSSNLYGR